MPRVRRCGARGEDDGDVLGDRGDRTDRAPVHPAAAFPPRRRPRRAAGPRVEQGQAGRARRPVAALRPRHAGHRRPRRAAARRVRSGPRRAARQRRPRRAPGRALRPHRRRRGKRQGQCGRHAQRRRPGRGPARRLPAPRVLGGRRGRPRRRLHRGDVRRRAAAGHAVPPDQVRGREDRPRAGPGAVAGVPARRRRRALRDRRNGQDRRPVLPLPRDQPARRAAGRAAARRRRTSATPTSCRSTTSPRRCWSWSSSPGSTATRSTWSTPSRSRSSSVYNAFAKAAGAPTITAQLGDRPLEADRRAGQADRAHPGRHHRPRRRAGAVRHPAGAAGDHGVPVGVLLRTRRARRWPAASRCRGWRTTRRRCGATGASTSTRSARASTARAASWTAAA